MPSAVAVCRGYLAACCSLLLPLSFHICRNGIFGNSSTHGPSDFGDGATRTSGQGDGSEGVQAIYTYTFGNLNSGAEVGLPRAPWAANIHVVFGKGLVSILTFFTPKLRSK